MSFTLINETNQKVPQAPFEAIMNEVLGTAYDLNLIIATPERMKELNTLYRDKKQATDILSFPLSDTEGEMYISLEETKREAKNFDRAYENFFIFLFIHGCAHLKGHDHGAIMEDIEVKVRQKFGV